MPFEAFADGVVRVLDLACGDGRFLLAAARTLRSRGLTPVLTGADIDLRGLRARPDHSEAIEAIETDSLHHDWAGREFDVVLGNPPFLSQMATATVRAGGSRFGGGPYADAAADFLALSVRLVRRDGGRVGLVLPVSLLTARDAGPIRAEVCRRAVIHSLWWSVEPVFDAFVRTCAITFETGTRRRPLGGSSAVQQWTGAAFRAAPDIVASGATVNDHWGWLIASSMGVPELPALNTAGTLSERGLVTANFRDQYYGLVGAVRDDADGPPLITTGLIDPGRCEWGVRSTRFAKQTFVAPRVDRSGLAPFMQRWAERCLVPKVLLATQSRVLEAVADPDGAWLPAVPVIRVVPAEPRDVWEIAAVLTSPVASVLVAEQSVGSGLSAATIRVSQRTLNTVAWPAGDLTEAVTALRDGDIVACGSAVDTAYGVDDPVLLGWWRSKL